MRDIDGNKLSTNDRVKVIEDNPFIRTSQIAVVICESELISNGCIIKYSDADYLLTSCKRLRKIFTIKDYAIACQKSVYGLVHAKAKQLRVKGNKLVKII